jgi:hypothetical protein
VSRPGLTIELLRLKLYIPPWVGSRQGHFVFGVLRREPSTSGVLIPFDRSAHIPTSLSSFQIILSQKLI